MENSEEDKSSTFKIPQPVQFRESTNESQVSKNFNSDIDVTTEIESKDKSDVKQAVKSKSLKDRADVPLPYVEPTWSGVPPSLYSFEVIKNGTFVETYDIRSSFVVFGRLDVCNIIFEHPSVSRYHAIVQYCEGDPTHKKGFYLYDLGSTHGTFLNKEKITPKIYYKLKVGYVLKFGGSTRLHIFQGPEEEEEDVEKVDLSKAEEDVCTWGMGEDAAEEDDLTENPFALSTPNEELYLDDPKKTLRGWFEREGYELEYDVEEKGFKTFVCRIQLPIDNASGDFMPVEASVSGKKKEAVIACALEACRTLDRLGLLRQSHQESRHRKKKKWEENDYYDSDEDTFLDRTGTIEKKREMRKRTEKKSEAETFESIEVKLKAVTEEINEITNKLSICKSDVKSEMSSEDDTLEVYMSSLSDSANMATDKIERRKLKYRLIEAEKEKSHLEKLLDIARPTKLPPVTKFPGMIGKRLKTKFQSPSIVSIKPKETATSSVKLNEKEEEIEEDSDTENMDVSEIKESKSISHVDNTENMDVSETSEPFSAIIQSSDNLQSKEVFNYNEKEAGHPKTYGLTLNPTSKNEDTFTNENESDLTSLANLKKRHIGCEKPETFTVSSNKDVSPSKKRKKDKKNEPNIDVYTTGNAEYTTWMPPPNQTGDGMTHLNAKYGY